MSKASIIIDEYTSFGDDLDEDHRKISFNFDHGDASVEVKVFIGKEDPTIDVVSDDLITDFIENSGHIDQTFEWRESESMRIDVADIDSVISGLTRVRQFIVARHGEKYLNDSE